ncbi:ATP-binding protein [Aeromicrobium massiliense]|uniref:ATP-binding protein n=1 Tax=Aeromicrobium massiliense TaxID=1464554 RepID=UPI0002F5DA1E|nr:ATP-binding protein [Aeromicrobium massiliense]
MAEPVRLTLATGADETAVDQTQDLLQTLWEQAPDVGDLDRIRLETAVAEVIGNIAKHTRRLDPPGSDSRRVHVTVWCSDEEVGAEFVDNGLPVAIDLSDVTMPDPDLDAESGRGLALALAAVDQLDYERLSGRNHWRLSCRRGGA